MKQGEGDLLGPKCLQSGPSNSLEIRSRNSFDSRIWNERAESSGYRASRMLKWEPPGRDVSEKPHDAKVRASTEGRFRKGCDEEEGI